MFLAYASSEASNAARCTDQFRRLARIACSSNIDYAYVAVTILGYECVGLNVGVVPLRRRLEDVVGVAAVLLPSYICYVSRTKTSLGLSTPREPLHNESPHFILTSGPLVAR